MRVTMPGKVYSACFDPMATDVPSEEGWPDAHPLRRGRGFTYVYEVDAEQVTEMIDHAWVWGSGLAFGTDPETQAEARAVLRWVELMQAVS